MNLAYADYIEINTNVTNELAYILVDSQADVCVLKENSLNNNYVLNTNDIITITGVVDTPIYSLGSINIELYINDTMIIHKFHIMPDEFCIPSDGIIGKDFMKLYECIMDYGNETFTISTGIEKLIIPMKLHDKNKMLIIPPRCEVTKIFKFSTKLPLFIRAQELQNGVMTSNAIARDGKALVNIVNTTEQIKKIPFPKLQHECLSNYTVWNATKVIAKESRTEELLKILKESYPDDKNIQNRLNEICREFSDIFFMDEDLLTQNNFYEQKLRLKDNEPVYTKNYRTPQTQKEEIHRQVKKLFDNKLIEPSAASYNSAVILVPKKSKTNDRKWRMCIDYRAVNKKLIPDRYPLPRIDEIMDNLGRAQYFSIIDLHSGFHQVPLHPDSRDITTFSTENGSFRWTVLPFGLNIAPNSFSRMMNIAFSGLPADRAFIYIDDIIVIGKTESEHFRNLISVFKILRDRNLKINPSKCEFFKHSVVFLGHKCTPNGFLPDDSKIRAMQTYPKPHDADSVRRFVAFANYYRKFIPNFAEISLPLTMLTRKKIKFEWTHIQQNAFEKLKKELISPRILRYPDFTKEFVIQVDSSTLACAGVLLQEYNDVLCPIAYYSRTFQKGEKNKAIIEKELLAIYHSIVAFRPYIYGKHFKIFSDHKPLVYLFTMKNPASKLVRIKMDLEEYDFSIVYIKGKDNILADALSRMEFSEIKNLQNENEQILVTTRSMTRSENRRIDKKCETKLKKEDLETKDGSVNIYEWGFNKKIPRIRSRKSLNGKKYKMTAYLRHKMLFEINIPLGDKLDLGVAIKTLNDAMEFNKLKEIQWPMNDQLLVHFGVEAIEENIFKYMKNKRIIMVKPPKEITNKNHQQELLKLYHEDEVFGGHCGSKKLYSRLRANYYWRNLSYDAYRFVKNCKKCLLNKPKRATREPMAITETPQKPFDIVIIDTIGPLPKSIYGNTYAVTAICDLSKYVVAIPIENKEAKTVAKALFENLILIYGTPKSIRTDLGTEYKNEVFNELSNMLKIKHRFSTSYHHQTLGSIERNHRVFNEYIRSYSDTNTWDVQLKYFCYCYNTSFNASLNHSFTPFELIFGKKANEIEFLDEKISPVYNIDNYIKILKHTLQKSYQKAVELVEKSKQKNKQLYDRKVNPIELNINDLVLIKKEPYNKFTPVYSGPHKIIQIDEHNVTIELNNKPYSVNKNRILKI